MKDVESNIDFQIFELGHQLDSDITKLRNARGFG